MSKGEKLNKYAKIFFVIHIIGSIAGGIALGVVSDGLGFLAIPVSIFIGWLGWLFVTTIADTNEQVGALREEIASLKLKAETPAENKTNGFNTTWEPIVETKTSKNGAKEEVQYANGDGNLASGLQDFTKSKTGNTQMGNYTFAKCAVCNKFRATQFIADETSPFSKQYVCDDCIGFNNISNKLI